MQKQRYHYRVIIEPDTRTGTDEPCYTATVPTLGITTDGDSIDETLTAVQDAISSYVSSLLDDGLKVPQDVKDSYLIATAEVTV